MEHHSEVTNPLTMTLTLEVTLYNPQDADSLLVYAIGRDTADSLRNDGFIIEPVYTGQRGGFFVDIVIPLLAAVWTNKDTILADSSALVTILTPIILITKRMREAYEKRTSKGNMQQPSIKITVVIDGSPVTVETPDLETADAALMLARRYQALHPNVAAKVTLQSEIKVKGSITKSHPRKKR